MISTNTGAIDPSLGDLRPGQQQTLLRDSPQRYVELVQSISAYGIYLLDREGRIASWNQGAENITGLNPRQAIGRRFAELFGRQAQTENLPEKTLQYVRANQHCREEQPRIKANGDAFIALTSLDSVRSASGELSGFVEVFEDITERRQREDALYKQATCDAMTQVYNRGHFNALAGQEIERARRFAEPLSVALLDIDHFKNVNDTYGHDVGDQAIIALARCCESSIRKIDFVGRLGGEEFAVLQPRASKQAAMEMANRLRQDIARIRIPLPPGHRIRELSFTASIGVAELRPHTENIRELLKNADSALYQSKREGRNRVTAWFD